MKPAIAINAAVAVDGKEKLVQLVACGDFESSNGIKQKVTPAEIAAVALNVRPGAELLVDYEHNTYLAAATGSKAAAGWITSVIDKGAEGLWGVVKWTANAARAIAEKEYRYMSPVLTGPFENGIMRPQHLLGAGLVARPAIEDIAALNHRNPFLEDSTMDLKQLALALGLPEGAPADKLMAAVALNAAVAAAARAALGLKADAGEKEIAEAVVALNAAKTTPAAVPADLLEPLGLKAGATVSDAKAAVLALNQHKLSPETAADLAMLKAKLADRDAKEAVAAALNAGKITAAQTGWAHSYATADLPGFEKFVIAAPVVVPQGASAAGPALNASGISAEQDAMNRQLGITAEAHAKYNKKPE